MVELHIKIFKSITYLPMMEMEMKGNYEKMFNGQCSSSSSFSWCKCVSPISFTLLQDSSCCSPSGVGC